MVAATHYILLLLIPGTICAKNYFRPHSGALQEHANSTHRAGSSSTHRPMNMFMLKLYKNFHLLESRHGTDLTPAMLHGFPSAPQADIIRSLAAKSIHKMGERCVLVFDFSSLSHDEELQFAEIQMRSSVLEKSFGDGTQVMLDIFHQNSACEESNELCKKLVYLGEFESAIRSRASERFGPEPWIVENVTEMVSKWFEISKKSDVPPKKEKEKFPGLESAKKRYKEHISEDQQVMMFVYSNTSNKEKSLVTASLLLDAIQSKYLATMPTIKNITIPRRPRRSSMIKDRKMGVEQDPHVNTPSNLCRRVDFIVDFKMIGWDEWILHPKKFNAYRCEGKCPSPVNERVRPNNHSYLQSLVNYYNSKKAPEVCCVPTKMSNLSMAFLEQADMDVHVHEAMIVEECGCR